MDALHTYKMQERVCWPAQAHRLPQSPCLLSLWGVLMLCMYPCRGEPRCCSSPDYGDQHPSEGCCQPGTLAPSLRATGAWQELVEGRGAWWDSSVLLSPAEITQKVIVSQGKGGAEAV